MADRNDHLERRCPRLGSDIRFGYCRISGEASLPCGKIFDCWWETFDVAAFLEETLPKGDFQRIKSFQPKPKLTSIIELIEEARKRSMNDT
jgi:hypothetical protein